MTLNQANKIKVAVVIPCYKVKKHIIDLLSNIPSIVDLIYIIDDHCPQKTGEFVEKFCNDPRVIIIKNHKNLGVGGSVMKGYQAAISSNVDIIIKIDGDGQMDPRLIKLFISPIIFGEADYTKGNRFFEIDSLKSMPRIRIFGNTILSLFTKLSSGYYNLFDPTNGYTAIHAEVAKMLPYNKINQRYFFESDMLFRLNLLRAVVIDVPMSAQYTDETSNLKIMNIIYEFLLRNFINFFKRVFYNYYLRDMSLASIQLILGIMLTIGGVFSGTWEMLHSANIKQITPAGTVMISALPILLGIQFILAFMSHDISSVPSYPIHKLLGSRFNKILNK